MFRFLVFASLLTVASNLFAKDQSWELSSEKHLTVSNNYCLRYPNIEHETAVNFKGKFQNYLHPVKLDFDSLRVGKKRDSYAPNGGKIELYCNKSRLIGKLKVDTNSELGSEVIDLGEIKGDGRIISGQQYHERLKFSATRSGPAEKLTVSLFFLFFGPVLKYANDTDSLVWQITDKDDNVYTATIYRQRSIWFRSEKKS